MIAKIKLPVLFLFFSASALAGAYIAQFGFGLEPCVLCLYQRIPYFIVIGISCIALTMKGKLEKYFNFLCIVTLVVGAGIAFYHVGVEEGIFKMTSGCADDISSLSFEDMKQALIAKPAVPCDKPTFVFLGISMAGYNFLYSLGLVIFSSIVMIRNKGK